MIVRDQLAVCHYFIKKSEFEKEQSASAKTIKKKSRSSVNKISAALDACDDIDEIFEVGNDLFFTDDANDTY